MRPDRGTTWRVPPPEVDRVVLGHGAGGSLSADLLAQVIRPELGLTAPCEDAAVLGEGDGEMVLSTDTYVVTPRVFPGGDIGALAVHGTVNDLAMMGARPVALCLAYILEEGLPLAELRRVTASVAREAAAAGVPVVTGDTAVVGAGAADGLYITTTGVGRRLRGARVHAAGVRPGDVVIVSGPVGLHGTAVMGARGEPGPGVVSDSRSLHWLVAQMIEAGAEHVHALRDPTHGGLAGALHELAMASGVGVELTEELLPVPRAVAEAAGILGADPLHAVCNGCLVAFVAPEAGAAVLAAMIAHPDGAEARRVGYATAEHPGRVLVRAAGGATRVVGPLDAEHWPRVC